MSEKRKRIGVVADDVTGSNDIGIMFVKGGYSAGVFPLDSLEGDEESIREAFGNLDVIIIDTDSRLDKPEKAVEKVRKATGILMNLPCDIYYKKTCSVFRGNIGAEFDAMQDVLGVDYSMVVVGFPANGRTTLNGTHYVNDIALDQTQFRNDPIHPMTTASLSEIIAQQSNRITALITVDQLDGGLNVVRARIDELKKNAAYIIFDVRNVADLTLIAEAVQDELTICGSSALGETLPAAINDNKELNAVNTVIPAELIEDGNGTLIIAGSLTDQTKEQIEYMKKIGTAVFELDSERIFIQDELDDDIAFIAEQAAGRISQGEDVLVYASNSNQKVSNTKLIGQVYGLTPEMVGRKISSALFSIVQGINERAGFSKLVVAGGDTSAAVSGGLGIAKMIIVNEVAPGVPNMYGYSGDTVYPLVLKSGSFGAEKFLKEAADSLRELIR